MPTADGRIASDAPVEAAPPIAADAGDAVWAHGVRETTEGGAAVSDEAVALAAACLDGLAAEDRVLLTLRYADGRGIGEVADLVGGSTATTTVALHRARGRFTAAYAGRVLTRPGASAACDAFRGDTIARAALRPAPDAYVAHAAACAWCRTSEAWLSARAGAFAAASRTAVSTASTPAVPAADPASVAPAAPAPAAVRRSGARIAVLAGAAVVAVVVVGGAAWALLGMGGGAEPAASASVSALAAPTVTPAPTRVAPPGFVAMDVVTCGRIAADGSLDAGGSEMGSADVKADALAGLDPTAFALYAVTDQDAAGGSAFYLAPRYWVCLRLGDDAGDFTRVSLMPTIPVLLEKLSSAPIVAVDPAGTFACGSPLDAAACAAARRIHEEPTLVVMH